MASGLSREVSFCIINYYLSSNDRHNRGRINISGRSKQWLVKASFTVYVVLTVHPKQTSTSWKQIRRRIHTDFKITVKDNFSTDLCAILISISPYLEKKYVH